MNSLAKVSVQIDGFIRSMNTEMNSSGDIGFAQGLFGGDSSGKNASGTVRIISTERRSLNAVMR